MAKAYQPFVYPQGAEQSQNQLRYGAMSSLIKGNKTPSAPRALTATPGSLKVTVAWEAPSVDDGATAWRVYRDTESNLVAEIKDRTQLQYDFSVEDVKKHNFFVSSVNAGKKESKKVLIQSAAAGFESSSVLNPQGSILPNQAITFTYAFTEDSIIISWSDQTMKRADESTLQVHAGSKSYSGLSSSTGYFIYSYVLVAQGSIGFANSNPPPTSPNPTQALNAYLDGRIPMALKVVTTAAAGGSGSGTGGGGDTCPEVSEQVETLERGVILAGDVQFGEHVKGYSFKKKQDVFRKVVSKRIAPCAAWYLVDGHKVSPCEPVYRDKWLNAFRITGAKFDMYSGEKLIITVESDEYDESNYYLVNGEPLLVHNWMASAS